MLGMCTLLQRQSARLIAAVAVLAASTNSHPIYAQQSDPLGALVAEALRSNLALATERLLVERSTHQLSEARGLFFPNLTLDSRYTRQNGTLNLGDVVNPAYTALNRILGTNQFPTNLDLTLPLAHDSRV